MESISSVLVKSKGELVEMAKAMKIGGVTAELKKAEIQLLVLRKMEVGGVVEEDKKEKFITKIPTLMPLLPSFEEDDVESFFNHFELCAKNFGWPKDCWTFLVQHCFKGAARSVFLALEYEQTLDYEKVKAVVLSAYSRCPEYYRRKFRQHDKGSNETFVEFLRRKEIDLDNWMRASKVENFQDFKQLILRENLCFSLSDTQRNFVTNKSGSIKETVIALDAYVVQNSSLSGSKFLSNIASGSDNNQNVQKWSQERSKESQESRNGKDKWHNNYKKALFCTGCRQKGHDYGHCFKRK